MHHGLQAAHGVLSVKVTRCYPGYFLVDMTVEDTHGPRPSRMPIKAAYNYDGAYVGNPKQARHLGERGIIPELADAKHTVCSIGRSTKDGKWYGWSHRAIHGFRKGDRVKEGDVTDELLPVGFEAATEEDKRAMAVSFASSVA